MKKILILHFCIVALSAGPHLLQCKTNSQDKSPEMISKTIHVPTWHAIEQKLKRKPFKYFSITIPKSGTHLLSKCINLLKNKTVTDHVNPKKPSKSKKCINITQKIFIDSQDDRILDRIIEKSHKGQSFASYHLVHSTIHEELLLKTAQVGLLLIRDPRDQLLSFINWVCEHSIRDTKTFNKTLLDFIDGKKRSDVHVVRMHSLSNFIWSFGIAEYYKLFLPWMSLKEFYTVRFENLVGSKGGGSDELQEQELSNIARHLNIPLSKERLEHTKANLFGGTNTFKKGQIGSWKEHFTPQHKAAFKRVAGQLLIDLGYEKDLNW